MKCRVWKCQYPIVFIPKYKKKVLYGKIREDVREIISTLCKYKGVDIIASAVCIDRVHLSVTIPSKLSVANFMGYLKGKSTLMIYDRYPELQSKWDKAFWARGYYVENIGNITYEAVGNISKASRRIKKRRFKKHRFISRPVTILETQPFGASSNIALWRTNNKPPVIKH
ncbi:IS200/IS605 family transposase [Fusicatenibacter saccharivorans]|uniref:IS200/IS605 family transposase n=1 Tax=Fusicatenibacter saccharivorans TaxID=1150298 RepID=UPI001D030AC5|nr:IS200/IS605 family transposase [Fusicatenibacter saccharivorans]MCB5527868.1 IS200/IS605 family transposase [Fusicatenibacter saccharivorans]MCB5673631.1 IS200/IS605 family transposase [Fusicatenibacter saccharivorans]MCB5692856.1 IS200/IS605 family transposase [Fusicatenibacter saccharivorans]MCB5696414.1 IS200/IS605 family transposase [Fusicatenibacter saccharivorans]MCC2732015.1 IS200/IS605 family transposase [Fusicatenibacter saccharivorans]